MNADTGAIADVDQLTSCPLCAGTRFTRLATPGHWIGAPVFAPVAGALGLVRCRTCALVFTNPRPTQELLWQFYSGNTYSCHEADGSASSGAHCDAVLARLAPHLPSGAPLSLLDFGAGGGQFLVDSARRGWTVRGYEPGKRGLEVCQTRGLDVTGDLADLAGSQFSAITLHHVFEHLADPAEVLGQLRSLLAPGGRVFIEVPNVDSLRARLAFPFMSRYFNADERHRAFPIHLMYYSAATLSRLLTDAGWVVDTAFTLGMGIEEYFRQDESHAPAPAKAAQVQAAPATRPRGGLRHRVRDAYLNAYLGENLAVIAH